MLINIFLYLDIFFFSCCWKIIKINIFIRFSWLSYSYTWIIVVLIYTFTENGNKLLYIFRFRLQVNSCNSLYEGFLLFFLTLHINKFRVGSTRKRKHARVSKKFNTQMFENDCVWNSHACVSIFKYIFAKTR
jgi:hypothetical protein